MSSLAVARYAQAAKVDEGWVPKVYKDYKGFKTLGYGHLVTKDSHKALTDLGVSKTRAQRILSGQGTLTAREGENLLLKNVSRKEKELQFLLKEKYQQLPTNKKVALLGLRFRGDFAKYNNKKGVLSKEYKHAMAGRFNLAAKAIQKRVRNKGEPLGVRRRVQRHTEPLLLVQRTEKKKGKPPQAGALALAVAVAAGVTALALKRKQKRKKKSLNSHALENNVPEILTHALNNNNNNNNKKEKVSKKKKAEKKPCGPGKVRNPATGRCIKAAPKQKEKKKPATAAQPKAQKKKRSLAVQAK